MKNLKYLVLAALATPALAADPALLKQYQSIDKDYYKFDLHATKGFTCHVQVSTLDASIANLRQQLAPHAAAFQVKENLADYAMSVDAQRGITMHDPSLDVTLVDEKGVSDPVRVRLGIQQIEQGFTTQVHGIGQVITSILDAYLDKTPDLVSITRDGSRWVIQTRDQGIDTTETMDGSHTHTESKGPGISVSADSDYTPVAGDKLALKSSHLTMMQGGQTAVTAMTVTYQKVGALVVPATIATDTTVQTPGAGQSEIPTTITFSACNITD